MGPGSAVPQDQRSTGMAVPQPELLASAFSAAPNGFLVIDTAGHILAANPALETMFGHASGALLGQPVELLLPQALQAGHAALRQQFAARPAPRAMGAGRVLHGRHRDGREFPVEIGLTPMPTDNGLLVLASVVDVSAQRAQEAALRGLFDASPYGKLIVDDAGQIALANRVLAQSLGYTPAQLLGRPLHLLLPPRYRGHHAALMAGYHATGEARMMGQGRDLTALHADGSELPVEIGLSRVHWQGRPMTLVAVSDISVRKRLELELRQANADLEEFSYVASHDLRSPLRGIADLVSWIEEDLDDPPPAVRKNLDRIAQRIQRMDRLMDDLLRYARAGRTATTITTVDLDALVRGILEIQPPPAGMAVQLALAVEPFQAARVPLETALRNLLANAVKHHDLPAGTLLVRARQDDSDVRIDVIDDGPGVPPAAQSRIFKLFQTASASERGGSGIGLALTKRLVETHGGRIDLVSPWPPHGAATGADPPPRGACFRIVWPRFAQRSNDA
jgi:PAS domain S-box-containing protein